MMKALVYTDVEEVTYRDEPIAQISADEALMKVEAVGICGSDMHAYLGHDARRKPPLILGHEACGTMVSGALKGKRCIVNPLMTCGHCDYCVDGRANLCGKRQLIGMFDRPGAFAEQLTIPERNLVEIPVDMAPEHAALTEPAATALHGIQLGSRFTARPLAELKVLVIGGGSVGLLAALFLSDSGAPNITLIEANARRRATASAAGNWNTVAPNDSAITDDRFDLVIDAVGSGITRATSSAAIKPGGVIVHIGLMDNDAGLDTRKLTLQEVIFIGTYTYTMVDLRAAVKKLYDKSLGELQWIEQRPLSEGAQAFKDLHAGHCAAAKVILRP